jgi:hypothetical protein
MDRHFSNTSFSEQLKPFQENSESLYRRFPPVCRGVESLSDTDGYILDVMSCGYSRSRGDVFEE